MEYYGIHIYDMSHYDLVIDTAGREIQDVLMEAIKAIAIYQ